MGIKIDDLVAPEAKQQLTEFMNTMESVKSRYVEICKEMIAGVNIKVTVIGDLDKLDALVRTTSRDLIDVSKQMTAAVEKEQQALKRTTVVIAEQLQKNAQYNASVRERANVDKEAMAIAKSFLGVYDERAEKYAELLRIEKQKRQAINDLNKQYKEQKVTTDEYEARLKVLQQTLRGVIAEKKEVAKTMAIEERMNATASGTYDNLRQQLEFYKSALKQIPQDALTSPEEQERVQRLRDAVSDLVTELKYQGELMGEHQMNVGNYASAMGGAAVNVKEVNRYLEDYRVATVNGKASTEDIARVMGIEATTTEQLIAQNKALTLAITQVDQSEAGAKDTIDAMNAKILENKMKILDVDSVMAAHATTIEDAKAQNKSLIEAQRLLDLTTDEGKTKFAEYGHRIAENRMFLAEHTAGLKENEDASKSELSALEAANAALATQATTIAEAEAQNKVLNAAIKEVNITEEDAIERIAQYRAKIEENDATISKFNGKLMENEQLFRSAENALNTDAQSASEAARQNEILAEAINQVNKHADGAKEKINQYNAKIKENERVIQSNQKASEGMVNTMAQMLGVNTRFGTSMQSLATSAANGGNVITGLTTKVKAFGQTALGLLSNPYMLAFLGIAGVAAGFKWWYDYNKGLVEASRQTKFFTGLTGEAMSAVRDKAQAVADTYGKDFAQTLKAATAISHNMGVTADEALDLINKGFAAGGVNSENYLNILQRFAPTMEKMGLSADQFVAFAGQIEKAGADTSKSMTAMGKASMQLRTMNISTANSLKAIGIDATQMSTDIQKGKKSVVEAMQEIAQKLQETGTNSRETAAVMKELFGARGESQIGTEFIAFLADAKVGTEDLLGAEDSLQRLKVKEVETQTELNNVVASLFEMGNGGFARMTTNAKIWVQQGLINAIKWVVRAINYFIDWYNESLLLRAAVNNIITQFKVMWEVVKLVCNLIIDAFKNVGRQIKAFGDIIEGIITFDSDKIKQGWKDITSSMAKYIKEGIGDIRAAGENIGQAFTDGFNSTARGHIDYIDVNSVSGANTDDGYGTGSGSGKEVANPTHAKDPEAEKAKKAAEKARKEAEKEAEKRRQQDLKAEEASLEARMELMTNYHEKEMANIKLQWLKKINAIKGEGEKERVARIELQTAMQHALAEAEYNYQKKKDETNLANHLASVKEGSEEEKNIKLQQLKAQREAELREAERTDADKKLINDKFDKQERELLEAYNKSRLEKLAETAATEQVIRDNTLKQQLIALQEQEAKELAAVGNNEQKIADIKDKYQRKSAELQEQYAIETAKAQLESVKKQLVALNVAEDQVDALLAQVNGGDIDGAVSLLEKQGMAHADALNLAKQLAEAQIDIANAEADAEIAAIQRVNDADTKSRDKRIANAEKWLNAATEAIGNITSLVNTLFDGQIAKIEEQQEANQAQYDAQIANIEQLAERGAITQEEAELRKREAEAATAKREEELAKKKAQAEYKQAVAEKANNISQIAIATALGIMKASPNWVNMALVAAMGAIQLATAIAQPIKAYKRGTEYHPGGPAIVGDGGKREVVESGGKFWLTPDIPTMLYLPEGAKVYEDRRKFLETIANEPPVNYGDVLAALPLPNFTPLIQSTYQPNVTVHNDYRDLQRDVRELGRLMRAMIRQQSRDAAKARYDQYRRERI